MDNDVAIVEEMTTNELEKENEVAIVEEVAETNEEAETVVGT